MRSLMMTLVCFTPLVRACGDKDDDTGSMGGGDPDLERAEQLWEDVQGYSAWDQVE